jgi:hypothetical protein
MDQNNLTAVEWLFSQLYENFEMKGDGEKMNEVLEQAKEMEKKQMKDIEFQKVLRPFRFNFEEYYNEKYGE